MYLIFGILFLILLLFICLGFWRKKKIIHKLCSMCANEKGLLLNELIQPFGYSYIPAQDVITSRRNAWQRNFGYCALYDRQAIRLNMVLDCLPVYFDYDGKTWLIELWKGQYGICTGCEIGIYYADRILEETERATALFHSVEDDDMLRLSLILFHKHRTLAHLCAKHWWLTAFCIGHFSSPAELSVHAVVALSSRAMAGAFFVGLINAGFTSDEITVCGRTVSFTFKESAPDKNCWCGLQKRLVQRMNRLACRMYLLLTRPFCRTVDRILYLYFYLPSAFRKLLSIRRYKDSRGKGG